jgi:hypothetical protein
MITQIESFRPTWSVKARITMGLLVALSFVAMLLLGVGVFLKVNSWVGPTAVMISAATMVAYGVWQGGGIALQQRDDYYAYLSGVDSNTLVTATTSEELSEDTRKAIIQYLNDTQPGWSFHPAPAMPQMDRG